MKVVLVDDHRIVREGLAFMLADEPDVELVGEAESGPGLLSLLAETEVDVVLLDIRMPEMSGLDVLEILTRDHPEVRVIILTMQDDPSLVRSAVEGGAAGYLLKSAGQQEVLRALRAVNAGKAYIQTEVTASLLAGIRGDEEDTPLGPREQQILQLVADGFENKQIARELGISEATVKTYLRRIFETLGAKGRAEAVAIGIRRAVIE
ncbi:MAG TPA: response regulator transcription factor [Acidimicrobiia bacterium]